MSVIHELTQKVISFRDARWWQSLHTPRNLAMALSVEASELVELYEWNNSPAAGEVADEIADVIIYALTLAHDSGIDVELSVLRKIEKNAIKYPAGAERKHGIPQRELF
jgi:NTP pyrophosphatase (non-canonical NTP hydrolase)